jgi:Protein of unknown function (DUF3574)
MDEMKPKVNLILGIAIAFILPLTVLAREQEAVECKPGKTFTRTELFFGMSKLDRSEVTSAEFQQFVERVVTPLFPEGLTMVAAKGQYRNSQGRVVIERSQLLTLLYPMNAESGQKVEQIRATYKKAFQQESVLRVEGRSCVSF